MHLTKQTARSRVSQLQHLHDTIKTCFLVTKKYFCFQKPDTIFLAFQDKHKFGQSKLYHQPVKLALSASQTQIS